MKTVSFNIPVATHAQKPYDQKQCNSEQFSRYAIKPHKRRKKHLAFCHLEKQLSNMQPAGKNIAGKLLTPINKVYSQQAFYQCIKLGDANFKTQNISKAISYYQRALGCYSSKADANNELRLLSGFVDTLVSQGDEEKAASCFEELSGIFQQLSESFQKQEADSYLEAGNDFFRGKSFTNAEKYYKKALNIYQKFHINEHEATLTSNLGSTCYATGDLEAAIYYHNLSLQCYKELGILSKQSYQAYCLAATCLLKKDYERAQSYCNDAFALYQQHKPGTMANLYFISAKAHEARNNKIAAINHYHKALTLFKSLQIAHKIVDIYNTLGHLYKAQGHQQRSDDCFNAALVHCGECEV